MAAEALESVPTVVNGNREPAKLHISDSAHKNTRLLIIGAGARGNAYARAVSESTKASVYAVADPIYQKRETLGSKYVWKNHDPVEGQSFSDWREFLEHERLRRQRKDEGESVSPGVDGVFICTLDEMHSEIIIGLAPLNLHIMSEKPLATNLKDCLDIYRSLQPPQDGSMGSLKYFKRSQKPVLAGDATNCLSCPAEKECIYSAQKIYEEKFLKSGNAGWPVHIVDPEIENLVGTEGMQWAIERLRSRLAEDYTKSTLKEDVENRPWFGRCVYESDNDVCDDQIVTMTWDDDPLPRKQHLSMDERLKGRGAKTAVFHMIAQTEKQCERRGRVYGSKGEIEYDSKMIRVYDFATSKAEVHYPHHPGGGHGGGDDGLTRHFVNAIEAVEQEATPIKEAQIRHIGCTLEDVIRSHAMVFAAEEARRKKMVIDWADWWQENVDSVMHISA
ncbi:MAG: hypothetical protein Q9188_004292 [Gyalolechia gomerana]